MWAELIAIVIDGPAATDVIFLSVLLNFISIVLYFPDNKSNPFLFAVYLNVTDLTSYNVGWDTFCIRWSAHRSASSYRLKLNPADGKFLWFLVLSVGRCTCQFYAVTKQRVVMWQAECPALVTISTAALPPSMQILHHTVLLQRSFPEMGRASGGAVTCPISASSLHPPLLSSTHLWKEKYQALHFPFFGFVFTGSRGQEITVRGTETSHCFTGLSPDTEYNATVFVQTPNLEGPPISVKERTCKSGNMNSECMKGMGSK